MLRVPGRVLLLALVLLLPAGCDSGAPNLAPARPAPLERVSSTPSPQPDLHIARPSPVAAVREQIRPGHLVYPLAARPLSLDPQEAADESEILVVYQLYEPLFRQAEDGTLLPAAADFVTATTDATVYSVHLRPDMRWSDGQPVLAEHYRDGLCRALNPAIGNPYSYLLADVIPVRGAKAYAEGAVADCGRVGIEASGTHTLTFSLERPAAAFPALLSAPLFLPARLDWSTKDVGPGMPPTNGPYVLAETTEDRLLLAANPDYWQAEGLAIAAVELPFESDLESLLARYRLGTVHTIAVPDNEVDRLMADQLLGGELRVIPKPGISYLAFNTQVTPTNRVEFRRAVAEAIDRQALLDDFIGQSWHQVARTLVPPAIAGYQAGAVIGDVAKDGADVQALLAKAGYDGTNPQPTLDIWSNREGHNQALVQGLVTMLEDAGMQTRLTTSTWGVYLAALDACNLSLNSEANRHPAECPYNIYRLGAIMDYPDPGNLLGRYLGPDSALQFTGWQSATYAELLERASREQDPGQRMLLYQEAERLLVNDEVVVVPLWFYDRAVLVRPEVHAAFPPFGPPSFRYWGT